MSCHHRKALGELRPRPSCHFSPHSVTSTCCIVCVYIGSSTTSLNNIVVVFWSNPHGFDQWEIKVPPEYWTSPKCSPLIHGPSSTFHERLHHTLFFWPILVNMISQFFSLVFFVLKPQRKVDPNMHKEAWRAGKSSHLQSSRSFMLWC